MSDLSFETSQPQQHAIAPGLGWLANRLAGSLLSRIQNGRLTIVTPSGHRLSHGNGNGP